MAKLTYQEVAEKADLLDQQNLNPTVKAVQTLLGGRSTDDIARHMKKWHETKSNILQKSWRMPDSISIAVDLEIGRRTAEVEARANEDRALTSQKTDELFDELKELHDAERKGWSRQQVQLQTDAEVGCRDSLESVQLRAQVRQLELDLQTRTVQLEASSQKIKGLEDSAASVQKIHEQARTAEVDVEVQRKLLEELKELHRNDRDTWNDERIQLRKDAEAGRRDSAENAQLREQMHKLEADAQSANTRFDKLAADQEGLQLTADSAQEFEERARVAEAAVKDLQKERDHYKLQATINAQMFEPLLDQIEVDGQALMGATEGHPPISAAFDAVDHLASADFAEGVTKGAAAH